jgi:WD40 repeat protein
MIGLSQKILLLIPLLALLIPQSLSSSAYHGGVPAQLIRTVSVIGTCKAISPNGCLLATVGKEGNIGTAYLYDTRTWRLLRKCPCGSADIETIAFTPDSKTMACGSKRRSVWLWDCMTGILRGKLAQLEYAYIGVVGMAFSSNGRTLAVLYSYNMAVLWNILSGEEIRVIYGESETDKLGPIMQSIGFSPNGKTVVTGDQTGIIRVYDLATKKIRLRWAGHVGSITSLVYLTKRGLVATACEDGSIRLWNARTGELSAELLEHKSAVRSLCVDGAQGRLASGSDDGTALVWDLESKRILFRVAESMNKPVALVGFSRSGKELTTGSSESVHVWGLTAK